MQACAFAQKKNCHRRRYARKPVRAPPDGRNANLLRTCHGTEQLGVSNPVSRVHIPPKLGGIIAALRQKTDYKRWADTRNLYSEWEPRTQRAAELIPAGSRVIEFGAGTRTLEKHLDPSCTYTPV